MRLLLAVADHRGQSAVGVLVNNGDGTFQPASVTVVNTSQA